MSARRTPSVSRGKQAGIAVGVSVFVLAAVVGLFVFLFFRTDDPDTYEDVVEHYKYGSIGSEAGGGIPYWIWLVLPEVFPEHLPQNKPGNGYERFGFVYEPGQDRPLGTSVREAPFPLIALNCASCHIGTVRDAPGAPAQIVLGMPAQQLDFLGYQRFLIAAAEDERFNGDTLIPAIKRVHDNFDWFEQQVYRYVVIPRLRDEIISRSKEFDFLNERPDWGPGRVDTFSPYKVHFGYDMRADNTIGTSDFPSLWNQGVREGMNLHWDGNNNSLAERNISAALGAGATEDSLDHPQIGRVASWIRDDLQPPAFPRDKIDARLAEAGRPLYERLCASCHALGGARTGQVEPLSSLGTDAERSKAFRADIAEKMNTYGGDAFWNFSNFKETDGYANAPLDGIWLRGPFLHNGSVPTLRDLLRPPAERPKVFFRGYDVYDYTNLGFVSSGPEAERVGFRFDTSQRGNGNGGHEYGTNLSEQDVRALLEYLKTQ